MGKSLQILKNDLGKAAIAKRTTELANATAEDRRRMLAQIDREIEKELRRRTSRVEPPGLIC